MTIYKPLNEKLRFKSCQRARHSPCLSPCPSSHYQNLPPSSPQKMKNKSINNIRFVAQITSQAEKTSLPFPCIPLSLTWGWNQEDQIMSLRAQHPHSRRAGDWTMFLTPYITPHLNWFLLCLTDLRNKILQNSSQSNWI